MAATNGYTLSTSAYTAIATDAVGRVRIVAVGRFTPKIAIASSQPSSSSDDWFPLFPNQIMTLEVLGGTTVWALGDSANGETQTVRVLKDAPVNTIVTQPLF